MRLENLEPIEQGCWLRLSHAGRDPELPGSRQTDISDISEDSSQPLPMPQHDQAARADASVSEAGSLRFCLFSHQTRLPVAGVCKAARAARGDTPALDPHPPQINAATARCAEGELLTLAGVD